MSPEAPRPGPAGTRAFPGGGRILFGDADGLQWVYPGGRVETVARRFLGGELFPGGTRLLAWKLVRENNEYFVMDLDGSNRQRVAGPGTHSAVALVRVSPDRTKVAYVRNWAGQGRARTRLFVRDLIAGRTTALGPFPSVTSEHDLNWNEDSLLLLARAHRGRAVAWINSATRDRGIYLRADERRLVRAFRRAWPAAPAPTGIAVLGWNPDSRSSSLAVLLTAPGRRRAVVVLTKKRTRALPLKDRRPDVTFEWISRQRFLLTTSRTTRERNATFYLGKAHAAKLSLLLRVNDLHAGPILGPGGKSLLFLKGRGAWQFVAARSGAHPTKASGTHGYPWEWAP